jgi:putative mRNA 3-end processing factor
VISSAVQVYNGAMCLNENPLIQVTNSGLYCDRGGFFIDPWRAVDRAVVTHAHADHLCWGCGRYLLAHDGLTVVRARLGDEPAITTVPYGEPLDMNGVRVSLHPAGHMLGSAQVRLEHGGKVWVVSGDYKVERDLTCAPFAPIPCHVFISECTFGLPVYRWPAQGDVFAEILTWWRGNQAAGRSSLLLAYALGKAQRLLAGLAATVGAEQGLPGPVYVHGAVEAMNRAYRGASINLPPTTYVAEAETSVNWSNALVIAPPSAHGTPWARKFGPASTAFASGWMRLRGTRRRRAVDRGFVLSDHVDWPALLATINDTGAETVWLTHGYTAVVTRWLKEQGKDAHAVVTRYEGERDDAVEPLEKPTNQLPASES